MAIEWKKVREESVCEREGALMEGLDISLALTIASSLNSTLSDAWNLSFHCWADACCRSVIRTLREICKNYIFDLSTHK